MAPADHRLIIKGSDDEQVLGSCQRAEKGEKLESDRCKIIIIKIMIIIIII